MRNILLLARASCLCFTASLASQGMCWAVEAGAEVPFDQPAMPLSDALRLVAQRTGTSIIAPDELVRGRTAPALAGSFTALAAAEALVARSGLGVSQADGALIVAAGQNAGKATDQAGGGGEKVTVTGSRIRGARVASPLIRLDDEAIRNSGQATVAEAVRTIPQNFGGGQNPGVGNNVPASNGVNVGGSTSINLRGLGSDATLTLLNGHRLSYSASRQAIDVSTIPLGIVDRIEIVPDGASALYGSDAVAGVANIVLKRDFDGIRAAARLGYSTDGGNFERRLGLTAGTTWAAGGVIAAIEGSDSSAILGKQRSYTEERSPALTLFPSMKSHGAALSAYQELGSGFEVSVDALYHNRKSRQAYALNAAGNIEQSGARFAYDSKSFVVAPTLSFAPGRDWRLFLSGSYGEDHTYYDVTSYFSGLTFPSTGNCYCNEAVSAELGGDGIIASLPGGPVKLAAGGGYRSNKLVRFNGKGADTNIEKRQESFYAYGELAVPIVSSEQGMRLVDRLNASAAGRFEHYPGIGSIFTPKVGLVYAPVAGAALRGSWGKSFRAPTLYQQYQAINAVLAPPAAFGGSGFPPGSTAFLLQGGNPDLKPERATSWSAGLDLHPQSMPGARLELSYFSTRYRDRVVTPILFLSRALSDPVNADQLTFNPSEEMLAEAIASAASFGNATGQPYDPAKVAVFIDDSNVNAAFQKLSGIDLLLNYSGSLSAVAGDISASLNGTYLTSKQKLGDGKPVTQLAGILFNPPHVRARASLTWSKGPVFLTGDMTYVGGVKDNRRDPSVKVEGMTTFDLTLRLLGRKGEGPLGGFDASLTAQNIFNAKPDRIAVTLPSDAPYDSTNYSPVGRFVAVSLSHTW